MEKTNINTIRDNTIDFNVPFAWALKKKKLYISSLLGDLRKQINETKQRLRESGSILEKELREDTLKYYENGFNSNRIYLNYLNNPDTDKKFITDVEIEIARNYPIQEFLPENYRGKGNINCLLPGHEDKNASMQTSNNFLWCHTCNKKMDSLDLAMMFHGIDFKSAVKLLTRS